jgi:hypothetical protein
VKDESGEEEFVTKSDFNTGRLTQQLKTLPDGYAIAVLPINVQDNQSQ